MDEKSAFFIPKTIFYGKTDLYSCPPLKTCKMKKEHIVEKIFKSYFSLLIKI